MSKNQENSSNSPIVTKILYFFVIPTILIFIDQITKFWFIRYLKTKPGLMAKPFSFLDFIYTWNYGISFGIFRSYYQYSNFAFGVINTCITIYLCTLLKKCKTLIGFLGYTLIVCGAVGNLIDRIFHGAVFDFIYFHYENYGFSIFNLADAFISIGVGLLLYEFIFSPKIK